MYHTHNSLDETIRNSEIPILNENLCQLLDLHSQVKQSHWMIRGHNFNAVHRLFDEVASAVLEYADKVAERIAQLGGVPLGTVRKVAEKTPLPQHDVSIKASDAHIELVAQLLAYVSESARVAIRKTAELGDDATADIFTEISRGLDEWTWFVESHGSAKD